MPVFTPMRPAHMAEEFTWTPYNVWWLIVVMATYFTLVFVPFDIAFSKQGGGVFPTRSLLASSSCAMESEAQYHAQPSTCQPQLCASNVQAHHVVEPKAVPLRPSAHVPALSPSCSVPASSPPAMACEKVGGRRAHSTPFMCMRAAQAAENGG
jgi:hypothetical protein